MTDAVSLSSILLKNQPPQPETVTDIFIVDFELSHIGHRSQDLGQCFAELYNLYHFKNHASALKIISGLCEGYKTGPVTPSDDFAFQVAMNFGIHLLVFPHNVGLGTKEDPEIIECSRFGNDLLVRGWRGDREWFRGGVMDALFSS